MCLIMHTHQAASLQLGFDQRFSRNTAVARLPPYQWFPVARRLSWIEDVSKNGAAGLGTKSPWPEVPALSESSVPTASGRF